MEENADTEVPQAQKAFDPDDQKRLIDYQITDPGKSSPDSFVLIKSDEANDEQKIESQNQVFNKEDS